MVKGEGKFWRKLQIFAAKRFGDFYRICQGLAVAVGGSLRSSIFAGKKKGKMVEVKRPYSNTF